MAIAITWKNNSGVTKKVSAANGSRVSVLPGQSVESYQNLESDGFVQTSVPGVLLSVSSDPGADAFTTAKVFDGVFNLSIIGSLWAGTVTLQRSYDGGATWEDVSDFTSNKETVIEEPQRGGLNYRIGIKNGNYTSGSVNMRLFK